MSCHQLKVKQKSLLEDYRRDLNRCGFLTTEQKKIVYKIASEVGIIINDAVAGDASIVPEIIKGSCGECRDGIVLAYSQNGALYVFVCYCDVGKKRPERYPNWALYRSDKTYTISLPGTEPRFDNKQSTPTKESIFSKENIAEMFQVMRDRASGKISGRDTYNYCKIIVQTLRDNDIYPDDEWAKGFENLVKEDLDG